MCQKLELITDTAQEFTIYETGSKKLLDLRYIFEKPNLTRKCN